MTGFDAIRRMLKLRVGNQNIVELDTASTLNLRANQFYLEDPTDITKKMQFDLSSLPTATTLTVAGNRRTVVDTGGAFATPIVLTAADSGKTYLLDDAAGLDFTLPVISASTVGMVFRFVIVTEVTSNSYRITAGEATDLMVGNVILYDKDVVEGSTEALIQILRPDVSDDDAITIAGADDTTGALVGGWLELEAVTATRWFVRGSLIGDGALATIFS